ncbi:hypothetical protein [Rhizobium hidalgonense]|uniref:hypothetical protein n=1 Tax=Rhizobium hidalgonense TaxID=1538159 RepID=UPI002871BC67|nr:hypothetical protein [Rhizobium hidalgonense]MDR9806871.1 hypothetical protein [Rhizobium hidalgonense]
MAIDLGGVKHSAAVLLTCFSERLHDLVHIFCSRQQRDVEIRRENPELAGVTKNPAVVATAGLFDA